MTIAIRLASLRRPPRYERRPRIIADRRARDALSREKRWARRGGSDWTGKAIAGAVLIGLMAAAWFIYKPDPAPAPPPLVFPEFVAQTEATFPEALKGHTRAWRGQLATGQEVPLGVSMLLPAHALESAKASPDALTRLSAPFVGGDRMIPGEEMGARIAHLAQAALPDGVTRCYTYQAAAQRRVTISEIRTILVTPVRILFNPDC